jgi:hypothetical protein
MKWIVWLFIALFVLPYILLSIVFANNNLYCAIYLHKDRKLWKYFIKNVPNFEFDHVYRPLAMKIYKFDKYLIVCYYSEGETSIHLNDEIRDCVLCTYDQKMSRKLFNAIKEYEGTKLCDATTALRKLEEDVDIQDPISS